MHGQRMRDSFTWRPGTVFVQSALVAASAITLAGIALVTLSAVNSSAEQVSRHSREAVLSGEILRTATELRATLLNQGNGTTLLSEHQQLTAAEALSAETALGEAALSATELHQLAGSRETLGLWGVVGDAQVELRRAALADNPPGLGRLDRSVQAFALLAGQLAPEFQAQAKADNQFNQDLASATRIAIVIAVTVSSLALGVATWLVSRRMNEALRRASKEKAMLVQTTQTMEKRNGQFRALYQVVTEVSDTLSMKYVVETTIRAARNLVGADVTALRLLRDDWLEVAGVSAGVDVDVEEMGPLALGAGIAGRAAKRGHSVLIGEDAEANMGPGEVIHGIQSGVVVPLIVGARVVGTMCCWSRQPGLFTEEDQQILELMASQVATAVASADSYQVAHTDTLTGLPNRRQLARDTEERFAPSLDHGRALAVAMVDIDHFKRFNDDYGHKTGDITLQKVASLLRASLRDEDLVYRYGGEEFTIVVEDATADEAVQRLERVRMAVELTPLTGDALQPVGPLTVSIGVAVHEDGADFDVLLKRADVALYQAKWEGRNRVTLWESGLGALHSAA